MIISASRRTDIPAYYSEWLFRRLKEGFVYVRNPMNIRQVGRVSLNPEVVDGIVLWTKNPLPMLGRLGGLAPYHYYFQFTITPYRSDVEANIPSKKDSVIPTFQRLSDAIGPERVIWRYDPILLSDTYTIGYHLKYFEKIAGRLKNHTAKCTISFIDYYRKMIPHIKGLNLKPLGVEDKLTLGKKLSEIARGHGLMMDSCAEDMDLSGCGIARARCVDGKQLEKIAGFSLKIPKDASQRPECGCVRSIDVGAYDTCLNGCQYCYATRGPEAARANFLQHDPASPLLTGTLQAADCLTERKAVSNVVAVHTQNTLF